MNFKNILCFLVLTVFLVGSFQHSQAGSVTIGRTPVLTATLPLNSTYQVEFSTNGTSWIGAGVLVAGNGASTSIRLDGFTNGNYRLSAVGVSNIVTPVVSSGWHVGASFPGATEARIESVNALGGVWTNRAFVFPSLQSPFVAPLRPPFSTNEFFRAVQPATPLILATLTGYTTDPNLTAAGYGIVADDMPQLYRDGFIAAVCPAVYHRDGTNAAAAGECYELVGPQGQTTVMVADFSPDSPNGTCNIGRPYFDVGMAAFTNIVPVNIGFGIATYRLVPAPVVGNLKMVCVNNAGGFYTELRPYNHRAGVTRLEVQGTGGSWTELPRSAYNSFIYSSGPQLVFPINVRVTSRFGEVVAFPAINSMANSERFTANGQFAIFPDQGPSPIWFLPPVYLDSLTNFLGAEWSTTGSGGPVNASYAGSVYQGSYSLRVLGMNQFTVLSFLSPQKFPRQPDAYLEFAIRSEGASIPRLEMMIAGLDGNGDSAQSSAVRLPTIDTTWRVYRIPLAPALTPPQITGFQLLNLTSSTLPAIDLDVIAFRW